MNGKQEVDHRLRLDFRPAAIVIVSLEGGGMTFTGYMVFFFIALASTMAVEAMIPDKKQRGSELLSELQDMKSRLDELKKESG